MTGTLYREPMLYAMLFEERAHDLGFYLALARETGDPLLELGVGTGRVALVLARAGHRVLGVDRAPAMLERLARRVAEEPPEVRARLTWQEADACTLDLGRRFPLVVYPFNGIAHQHRDEDLARLLARVRAHLAPGALFAFDTLLPDPARLGGGAVEVPWFRDPRTGEVARCTETTEYDPETGVFSVSLELRFMETERPPERLDLALRQLWPDQTRLLLARSGFEVLRETDGAGDSVAYICRAAV